MKRIVFISILLLLLLAPTGYVLASPFDRIIRSGETVDDDITVVDDRLVVEEGAVVDGNVTVFSGSADIAGEITGHVTVFGGELALSGVIDGDVVVFGGALDLAQGADISGSCVTLGGGIDDQSDGVSCSAFGNRLGAFGVFQFPPLPEMGEMPALPEAQEMPEMPSAPEMPEMPEMPEAPTAPPIDVRPPSFASRIGHQFLNLGAVVGRSLLMGILALIVTAIFPRQLQQVTSTVRTKPAASGAVGFLTAIAGPSIIVLLLVVLAITCVGLLLYPAVFLLGLALFAALVMGWIAVGDILGRMVLGRLSTKQSLPVTAALGTGLLTLVLGVLGLLPFIWGESLVVFLLACVGLGAVTLTQFGVKRYPPDAVPPQNSGKVDDALKNMPAE